MAQNSAWVIAGLGAFPPHLLFLSPKNLMCCKVLIFHPTLFSRRKSPEVQITFLESPFCLYFTFISMESPPSAQRIRFLPRISVFQGSFCTRNPQIAFSFVYQHIPCDTLGLYSTFLISSAFEKTIWKISHCWFYAGSSEDYSRWRNTNFIQGEKPAWLQFIVIQAHNR